MKILTQGAAKSTLRDAEISTLEAGKFADSSGRRLARDPEALQQVVTTIKVVFEKR